MDSNLPQADQHVKFFSEISEHQISAHEFFNCVLLDSLIRNFHFSNILISYFDPQGKFLSWTHPSGILTDSPTHPYHTFQSVDVVRNLIYQEAVRDKLTYFNVNPRLYRSTDIITFMDYDQSAYVQFIEKFFSAHYSVTLAFGINAYIQVTFFKTYSDGNFNDREMEDLRKIYVYIANSYKNFKKYEQARIISNIQGEIIASGEKAYLVTDDFMHILSYNRQASDYLTDLLGPCATEGLNGNTPCTWLPFLLGSTDTETEDHVRTRVIQNCIFKIYTYNQTYSNGIVDRYHWITISDFSPTASSDLSCTIPSETDLSPLTQAEQRIALLLYHGLTYKAVASQLVVSYHTVKKHVQNIYTKCNLNSRYQLYRWIEERLK